ncbi:MAG TPA: hypothetical protein VFZ66_11315 [Herpetosiphonaceae bacterium]
MTLPALDRWVPIRLYWQRQQPMLDWCYLGARRLTEPFFDQSIDACLRHPFNVLFRHQTPLDALGELLARSPGLPPTGFIFHMSRCGSTLVAQMLAALPQHIVIAEAGPIDGVLRANLHDPTISDQQRIAWLRWIVGAYGRRRSAEERRYFIKFDSWHALDLPLIRRAFPTVPWIFVYRDPIEVLVSHARMPGSQMVPGLVDPRVFGLDLETAVQMPQIEYRSRVLASICRAAVEMPRDQRLVIPYRRLPDAVWDTLLDFFRIEHSTLDIEQMQHVAQFNAKSPRQPFEQDAQAKRQAASDEIRQVVDRWVRPWYEQLDRLYAVQGDP